MGVDELTWATRWCWLSLIFRPGPVSAPRVIVGPPPGTTYLVAWADGDGRGIDDGIAALGLGLGAGAATSPPPVSSKPRTKKAIAMTTPTTSPAASRMGHTDRPRRRLFM